MHPEDRARAEAVVARAIEQRGRISDEHRVLLPSGEVRWIAVEGRSYFEPDTHQVTRASGVFYDITPRKETEARLRESEEEYRSLFVRFRATLDSAMDGIITVDATQRIVLFNRAAEAMFRCSAAEALGSPLDRFIPERSRGAHGEHLRALGASGPSMRAMDRISAVSALRADGTEFPIEASVSHVVVGEDRLFTVILRDVTERKTLEAERERSLAALQDADRRKDQFLATLAHELRNPLAPIRTGVELVKRTRAAGESTDRALEVMGRQVDHMVRLIDDLLDISRISRGAISLRTVPVSLASVVQQAVEPCQSALEKKGHRLTVHVLDQLQVNGDPDRLVQVIANLIQNATKFTPPGGRVAVKVRREGDDAVVCVRDTGVGIAPDKLERVFEMFAQVDAAPGHGGLGIGLWLCRELVGLHGGTIEAHSEGLGRGSELVVRLPVLASNGAALGEAARAEAPEAAPALDILVVDDNKDAATMLGSILESSGHAVRVVYDGGDALASAAARHPDVALLDLGRPGMSGFEVARALRDEPWGSNVTIVAVTGWGQDADRSRSREAGFDEHLVKPVDLARLERVLSTVRARR